MLGVHKLAIFNRGMLAKQEWRLLSDESSLFAQLLKACYFRNSSFREVVLGSSSSYTWQSLMEGWKLLENGLGWRVGDGMRVKVWHDAWINYFEHPRIMGPTTEDDGNMRVADLNMEGSGTWNQQKVSTLFTQTIADLIPTTPLCRTLGSDVLQWSGAKDGVYSMRSGY